MPLPPALVGTVVDSSGAPIPNAHAFVSHYPYPNKSASATADDRGSFTLQLGRAHGDALTVEAPGYLPFREELYHDKKYSELLRTNRNNPAPTTYTRTFTLQKSAPLSGYVADDQGIALSGVAVRAYEAMSKSHGYEKELAAVITDGDGAFNLPQVPATDLFLKFSAPGFADASQKVSPGEKVAINLTRGTTLVGKVFDAETRQPAGGTTIALILENPNPVQDYSQPRPRVMEWSATGYAGHSGTISFRNVPPGNYIIHVPQDHSRFGPSIQSKQVWNPENAGRMTVSISGNEPQVGVEVPVFDGYTVTGKVLETGTSNTVPNARVWFLSGHPHRSVQADANGEFRFEKVFSPGRGASVQLTAEQDGFSMMTPRFGSHLTTQTVSYVFPTSTTILQANISLLRQLELKGRVVDAMTSMPVQGARVTPISSTNYHEERDRQNTKLTDGDGRFSLSTLPGQAIRIRTQADGYAPHISEIIRLAPEQDIEVALDRGGSIEGRVLTPDNSPAADADIFASFQISGATDSSNNSTSYNESLGIAGKSAVEGNFRLTNLPVGGSIVLHARKRGFAVSEKQTIGVSAGDDVGSITLQLRVGKHLAGRILDSAGAPLGDVSVVATSRGTYGHGVTQTKADGVYKLVDRPDAPVDVSITHSRQGNEWFYNVAVGRDGVDFQFGKGDKNGTQRYQQMADADKEKNTGLTMYGLVVDWQTGEPVKDFEIVGSQYLKFTKDPDLDGVFTATGFRVANPYQMLRITSPNYAVYDSGPIYIADGKTELRRTFKLGPGGSITGRAIEKGTGNPVPNVTVSLSEVQTGTGQLPKTAAEKVQPVTTDAEGRFTLAGIGQGHKTIAYDPPAATGFVKMTQPTDVIYNEVTDLGDVEFGTGGTIKGRLIRTPGDTPIPNAQVTIRNQKEPKTTDGDGRFEFTNLVNGLYYVEAPQFGANAWIGVEQLETKELTLEVGTGQLTGLVMRGGKPFSCAVKVQKIGYGQSVARFATADSAGRFIVSDLAPGRWKVELTGSAGAPFTVSEFIVMPESGESLEKTFTLPSGSLRVTVIDSTSKAVSGATVIIRQQAAADAPLQPETISRVSNNAGEAVAEGLSAGTFSVSATNDDGDRGEKSGVDVSNDQTAAVTVTINSTVGGNLISTALNMATGKPVPTAWCHIFNQEGQLFEHGKMRDELGVVMVESIPPGTYRVQVSALGFSVSEQQVTIQAGQTSTIDDVLYPSGALRWALRNSTGAPAVGVPCTLTPNDPASIEDARSGTSNDAGVFVVRGLMPGAYTATANPSGGKSVSRSVMIYAANVTDEVSQVE